MTLKQKGERKKEKRNLFWYFHKVITVTIFIRFQLIFFLLPNKLPNPGWFWNGQACCRLSLAQTKLVQYNMTTQQILSIGEVRFKVGSL